MASFDSVEVLINHFLCRRQQVAVAFATLDRRIFPINYSRIAIWRYIFFGMLDCLLPGNNWTRISEEKGGRVRDPL